MCHIMCVEVRRQLCTVDSPSTFMCILGIKLRLSNWMAEILPNDPSHYHISQEF